MKCNNIISKVQNYIAKAGISFKIFMGVMILEVFLVIYFLSSGMFFEEPSPATMFLVMIPGTFLLASMGYMGLTLEKKKCSIHDIAYA